MEGEYDEDERTAGPATPHLTGGDYYAILNVPRDVRLCCSVPPRVTSGEAGAV